MLLASKSPYCCDSKGHVDAMENGVSDYFDGTARGAKKQIVSTAASVLRVSRAVRFQGLSGAFRSEN